MIIIILLVKKETWVIVNEVDWRIEIMGWDSYSICIVQLFLFLFSNGGCHSSSI